MVLDLAEMDFNLKVKWFVQPRQLDGSTVEDYYAQFCNWRQEMVRLSIPAEEEDYVEKFTLNLRWDVRCRLCKYESCWSRLIDVYHDARFEELMMIIEENLKQIKANRVYDEMPSRTHGANCNDDNTQLVFESIEQPQASGKEDFNTAITSEKLVNPVDEMGSQPPIEIQGDYICDSSEEKSIEQITDGEMLDVNGQGIAEETMLLEDDSQNFIMSKGLECKMFDNSTDKSTEPNFAGLNHFYGNFYSCPMIEEVELSLHKGGRLLNEKFQHSYSCKHEVTDVAYHLFDKKANPGHTFLHSFSPDSLFGNEEKDDLTSIKVDNQFVDYKLHDHIWLNESLMLIFDPGGCSQLHMGCGSLKCCNEQGDYFWVVNVAQPLIINDPLITHQEACNEWSEVDVQKFEVFKSANPMTGISVVSTCAIRFEGEIYAITRATSAKNVMVDDAFDIMTKSTQMEVSRVHRAMISIHNSHSSFLVENKWCLSDLSSHSKNNLVYTKCENLYSLNEMLVLVFDPGGCSFLCMDCRLLEYNEEHADLHFTTNAVDGPEIFYNAFDEDSANQFSKGIDILGLSIGLQSMTFSWVVFEEQLCEQKHAFIILRNSQQALLPLAYTMHIKYTLLGSNILGYQNAAIQRITHKIFYLLDGFMHSQVLTQIFCVDELILVDLNIDRLHTFMYAFRVETMVQQHIKFLSDGNDSSSGKVHEDFGSKIMSIGLDMSRCKEFNWFLLLGGHRCFLHHLSSIGIIVTKLQIFIWDPGQNIISIFYTHP